MDTPEGRGTVIELDLLRQRVKVRMEDSPETVSTFSNEDIAVLRNGKAKKNDPPIPGDLAPISGNGRKRPHKDQETEEDKLVLEPIKFRYSTEKIVEDEQPDLEEQKPEGEARRRRRRPAKPADRQEGKPQEKKPQEKKEGRPAEKREPRQEPRKEAQPHPKAEGEEGEKKHRRPGHYRRRRPRQGGENKGTGTPT